jgi:hypothetical protein
MDMPRLMSTIISSEPESWNTITCWGANSGPSYHYKIVTHQYQGQPNRLESAAQNIVAVYKPDVSISLAWGLVMNSNFQEQWINTFHDRRASSHFVDLFYNKSLVHRAIYVVMDGGRAKLPLAILKDSELQVPKAYHDFIKLIDQIDTYHSQFDSYFQRANFKIIEEAWP